MSFTNSYFSLVELTEAMPSVVESVEEDDLDWDAHDEL